MCNRICKNYHQVNKSTLTLLTHLCLDTHCFSCLETVYDLTRYAIQMIVSSDDITFESNFTFKYVFLLKSGMAFIHGNRMNRKSHITSM